MTGDTLKRVRSIRKWLEKAEKSYDSDKQISGELNLIMAQAEMQRLKEADPKGERRRVWGFRAVAFSAALVVIGAASFLQDLWMTPAPAAAVSASQQSEISQPVTAADAPVEPAEAVETQPEVQEVSAEETAPAVKETVDTPVPAAAPAPAPLQYAAPAAPVMSQQEIQSVVGEAGRALRGQS